MKQNWKASDTGTNPDGIREEMSMMCQVSPSDTTEAWQESNCIPPSAITEWDG
jgi:hypothetical protein